ncbi:MAG: xanthine dehydrogenase subunit XdhB [Christensenellaceae bacterium]|jgi:xanthine dehydrogenase FAD-binding subunit
MYDISRLYEPQSVSEAVKILQKHPEARVLAGGSDLLLKIREGKLAGIECVSIYKLDALRGISMEADGSIAILPLTSFSHVARNELVLEHIPVLAEAVETIGGPQIRNIGTIGGNVCNGVTSADSASTLFSLDAELELTGSGGVRTVPIHDFYIGPGKVDLRPTEILTTIRIPQKSYEGYHGKFIKYAMRKAMDISTLNCSVNVKLSGDKKLIEDVRIAFGVASPTPMRCSAAENCTCGKPVGEETLRSLVDTALSEITPRTSWRASRELRMQLAAELAMRALKEAVQRAGGVL